MTADQLSLYQYTSQGSRQALDELIRRYMNMVYSSALRQVGDPHLAEDVTQAVFLILSRKAHKIRAGVPVGGWLLTVTRRTAVDAMRRRTLDRRHEQAIAKPEMAPAEAAHWDQISPVLDAALGRLPRHDRDAVVLRVFENQSLAQVGAELGISPEAAKKRVSRALSSLRTFLQGHGISTGAAALTTSLAARAVHAAPPHLLAAALSGIPSASAMAIAKGTLSTMAWASAKIAAGIMLAFLLATTGYALSKSSIRPAKVPALAAPVEISKQVDQPHLAGPASFGTIDFVRNPTPFTEPNLNRVPQYNFNGSMGPTRAMATDSAGNIYAVGTVSLSGDGIVRELPRGQAQWSTILNLPRFTFHAVAVNTAGDVYVAGEEWLILKRLAGQSNFLDSPVNPRETHNGSSAISALVTDAQGNIYAVGNINSHWIVRKQTGGSGRFVTVDDFLPGGRPKPLLEEPRGHWLLLANPSDAGCVLIVPGSGPSAGIYVAGSAYESASTSSAAYRAHWIVRKTIDGGNTWSTVDDFIRDPLSPDGENLGPRAMCADVAGNIYVVGVAENIVPTGAHYNDAPATHWITRKSATGAANSWFTDDDLDLGGALAVGTDLTGNVYVVGGEIDETGGRVHGIIRSNAGGTWQTVDEYRFESNRTFLTSITVDLDGRLYVAGSFRGVGTGWVIRSAMTAKPVKTRSSAQNAKPVLER